MSHSWVFIYLSPFHRLACWFSLSSSA